MCVWELDKSGFIIFGKRRGRIVKIGVRVEERQGKCCIVITECEGIRLFDDEFLWEKGCEVEVGEVEGMWGFLKEFLADFLPSHLGKK